MTLDPKLFDGHTPAPWRVEEDDEFGGHPFIPVEAGDGPSWHSIAEIQGSGEGGEITAEDRANAHLIAHAAEIEAERVRLVVRVAELEGALKPFSDAANVRLCGEFSDKERFGQTDITFHLTFGDLRRARAALGPTP